MKGYGARCTRWLLLIACGAAAQAAAQEAQLRRSHGGTTTLHVNMPVLQSAGVHIARIEQDLPLPASSKRGGYRHFAFAALDATQFRFRESAGLPRAFDGGGLQHAGGLLLDFPGGTADLRAFTLRPNARAPFALDIVGGDGRTWFTLDRGHYQLEDDGTGRAHGTFALRYMNLHLSAYFARRLGRADFAGLAVGGADTLSPLDAADATAVVDAACSAPWPGQAGAGADVRMVLPASDAETGAPDAIHFQRCGLPDGNGSWLVATCTATSTDRGVVFAPDTSLVNAGTTTVSWHRMFSAPAPPYGNDQHPFLVWNLYRIDADGALHQLAASGAKHAFNTINKTCNCADHANSYPTCEDSYSEYSNDIDAITQPNYLGPRSEIIPARGVFGRCLSVFDKNCDGALDADAGADDAFQYRTVVRESEITPSLQPGARYFFEYWYVVRDQTDIYDAMGFRPLAFSKVAGSGGAYLWNAAPLTLQNNASFANGAVIDYWVDPASPPSGALNRELVTSDGRARVAVRSTPLGGAWYRYDYAVMNFDFARAVIDAAHAAEPDLHVLSADGFSAFVLPLGAGATVRDVVFNDADGDASNDWAFSSDANGLRWQAPAGHPLNWGTLYRFSFSADRAPLAANAQLDVANPGSPSSYGIATLAPLDDTVFRNGFENG